MSRSTRKGFSLAELMIFMLLLGMLITGMYLLLVAGMRNVQRSQAYQEAQTQGLKGIRTLVNEISEARADSAYLIYNAVTPGPRIAFLSGYQPYPGQQDRLIYPKVPTASDPSPPVPLYYGVIWQKWVGFVLDGEDLVRFENTNTGARATNGKCHACAADSIGECLDVSFPSYKSPIYPAAGSLLSAVPAAPVNGTTPGTGWKNKQIVARNIYSLEFEPASTTLPSGIKITLYASDENASDRITQVRYQVTAWMTN